MALFWSIGLGDHELPWLGSQPTVVPYGPRKLSCDEKHDQNEQVAHQHFSNIWKLLHFNDHTLRQMKREASLQSLACEGWDFRVWLKISCTAGFSRKLSNTVIMSILEGLPGNSKAERLQNDFAHLICFLLTLLLLHAFVSDPSLWLILDGACFSDNSLIL